jgi:hypothetical protein
LFQLDIGSADAHFSQHVLKLAIHEPIVYYACLSYASYVLLLQANIEPLVAREYYEKTVRLLIEALSEEGRGQATEPLMVATAILRMREQFSDPTNDGRFHLDAAFAVFAQPGYTWSTCSTDLKGCAFWLFVRQNIRASFLNQEKLRCDLSFVEEEASYSPAEDVVWTNRMTLLVAQLCNACWSGTVSEAQLFLLETRLAEWKSKVPSSFQCWTTATRSDSPFATIRYLLPCHSKCLIVRCNELIAELTALAWHFYYTAKVLIGVYRPLRLVDEQVLAINQHISVCARQVSEIPEFY